MEDIVKKLSLFRQNKLEKDTQDIYTEIGFDIENYSDKDIHSNMDKKYQLTEFFEIIQDIISNDTVKQMKNFRQHYNSSCYEHCLEVAYWSYLICKKLNLDYVSAARARNAS